MLIQLLSRHIRAAYRFSLKSILGPLAPIYPLTQYSPELIFRDAISLKGLRDFSRQERKPGLRPTHLLVGHSGSREVWLDSGRHFVVSGPAGCGKSVLESFFTFQRVAMGLPVLVLDWVGDGSTRERIQTGLKLAGLPLLEDLAISDVHQFNGIWQGQGMVDVKAAMDAMRLVLERMTHRCSQMGAPMDKPHLILIPEADWLLHNLESQDYKLMLSLFPQLRALNVSVGLFTQSSLEVTLANCSTSVEFDRGLPAGECLVRTGSLLLNGIEPSRGGIITQVPFFNPSMD